MTLIGLVTFFLVLGVATGSTVFCFWLLKIVTAASTNNKINNARCTFAALASLRQPDKKSVKTKEKKEVKTEVKEEKTVKAAPKKAATKK